MLVERHLEFRFLTFSSQPAKRTGNVTKCALDSRSPSKITSLKLTLRYSSSLKLAKTVKDLPLMETELQFPELSAQDRKILKALQDDGRLSNADLAKQVGLSPSACWNHTRRLFDTKVIKGVRALIEPRAVQRETAVLVGIVLDRSTPDSFREFADATRTLPQVLECFLVAGEVDYFLKIRVRDLNAFNRLHSEKILALPGVRQVRTFFVLDEVKADGPLAF